MTGQNMSEPTQRLIETNGIDVAVANKELIVADMRLNAVLTYYFPEIF